MSTKQSQPLNLQSDGISKWLHKNGLSLTQKSIQNDEKLSSRLHPKSKESDCSETKQAMHCRSGSQSEVMTFTNQTELSRSFVNNNLNIRRANNNKYRKSVSYSTTNIQSQSLQLVTPQTPSSSSSRSQHIILNGSLISNNLRKCKSKLLSAPLPIEDMDNNTKKRQICANTKGKNNNKSLTNWLLSMDIVQYKELFERNGFDQMAAIVELDENDLREMNIPKGHCKMILRQVHNLQNELNIKPLFLKSSNPNHQRNLSQPETIQKQPTHSNQSYSFDHIPPINVILDGIDHESLSEFEQQNDDKSVHKSCGFPDIDSSKIDLNKVHFGPNGYVQNAAPSTNGSTTQTAGYHTFPRSSTNGSPFPLNKNLKNANNALQSLEKICLPKVIETKLSPCRTFNSSSSSLPSFHGTDMNDAAYDNILPLVHRYQPSQSAQRYIVYHPQNLQNNAQIIANYQRKNKYFISDEEEHKNDDDDEKRRHSLCNSVSNDYILYQTEEKKQRKKGWIGSRVYKKKKKKKKKRHNQSKSSPFINMTANKLFANRKSDKMSQKNKLEQSVYTSSKLKTNRINLPWFLCGSSKNSQKNNLFSSTINIEQKEQKSHSTPSQSIQKTPELIPKQQQAQMSSDYFMNLLPTAIEFHQNGQIEEAADHFAQYLHYYRNDIDARLRYALCLLDLQQFESCQCQLDALIECDENNVNNCMLQFVYGLLHHKLDNFDIACHHYDAALLTGYPFADRIYNNLASLFRKHSDYVNAEKYQLLALQNDDKNHVFLLNYAKILCDMKRFDDAAKAYQNAICLQPHFADLYVEYALFLMHVKEDYLLAATQLNIAHKLSPHNEEINDLLMQATEYCANLSSEDSINSDTIVTLSAESQSESENDDQEEIEFDNLQQIEFDERVSSNNVSMRKQSLPINLPKPAALNGLKSISETSNIEFDALKDRICDNLPPPHNPHNPNDPVRRNSLLNMNRVQLNDFVNRNRSKYDCDGGRAEDDDTMSVVSMLSN